MRAVVLSLCATIIACGPPTTASNSTTRCASDSDCRSDFVCVERKCRRPLGSDGGTPVGDGGVSLADGGEPMTDAGPIGDGGGSVCGNGIREIGEFCDDGNRSNNDACLNNCEPNRCGDMILNPEAEQCDDGNTRSGDGCDENCQVEAEPVCGNGVVEGDEECDDGNNRGGDGCDPDCFVEEGPACGNGVVEAGEACDDGNRVAGDGCDENCQAEAGGEDDYGNTPEEAMRITVPAELNGVIEQAGDRDYFRFFSSAAAIYTIETGGMTDTVCQVEFNGNIAGSDDNSGTGNNCRIQVRLESGRTYYVRVSGAARSLGRYQLMVSR